MSLHVEIATPERQVFAGEVAELRAPGVQGEFGVLPGHIPFLSTLGVGPLTLVKENGESEVYAAGHGFVEVLNDRVTVLASVCENARDIDTARAEKARKRAEEALAKWEPLTSTTEATTAEQEEEAQQLRETAERKTAEIFADDTQKKLAYKLARAVNRLQIAQFTKAK